MRNKTKNKMKNKRKTRGGAGSIKPTDITVSRLIEIINESASYDALRGALGANVAGPEAAVPEAPEASGAAEGPETPETPQASGAENENELNITTSPLNVAEQIKSPLP